MTSLVGLLFTTGTYQWGYVPSREYANHLHGAVDIRHFPHSSKVFYITGRLSADGLLRVDSKPYLVKLTRSYDVFLGGTVGLDGFNFGTEDKHSYDTGSWNMK